MAEDFVPPDFDERAILEGLHLAMGFGAATRVEDRATFYVPKAAVVAAAIEDERGVPFDPTVRRAESVTRKSVACAVEFYNATGIVETFGATAPTRIKITLLDGEYQDVKDYLYVVAGGDKYLRGKTEPPVALGTIDVWTCWADAESER